jgi:hypothetical protein
MATTVEEQGSLATKTAALVGSDPMASESGHGHRPSALIALLAVPLVVAIALATFAWPASNLEPRDLPIGVAGPPQARAPVEQKLAQQEGAFDVQRYADEAAARKAIEDRDVYGAVVVAPGGAKLLTASAGSATVAGLLEENLAGPRVQAADIVPAPSGDPRGTGFGSMGLPIILAGIIAGVIVTLLGRPGVGAIGILLGVSVLSGLVTVLMVQPWLGILEGPWLLNAAVVSLGVLTIASVVTGLAALIGPAGIGVAALLFVFVGNPWSGTGSAPELLPSAAGFIGQLLPPGASAQLLRGTAFFDGGGAGGHLAVLLVWTVLGLGAILAGAKLRQPESGGAR